ncbi:MAG TPA: uroporphyrinogen-III synthase [Pseudomonas xinjiangensis]|uniref:Uroporphyrinogen-III synthase n=2 Tax=root TaxID=1 RepID=A0A7V1BMS7_9GAMM|nr:uroporphyrinogen-III synthase [Halopseudomonas xinjiangensis]HEC46137.1 uroporphyrinogen-III synthase [Halopseudomonas xinjiangensis]
MSAALLLTRSAPDNQRLAARLNAVGVRTLSLPLLQIEELEESPEQRQLILDLDRYHAVMVVSPVAARLGLNRLDTYWPQAPVGIEWLAVGQTSAAILEAYGLATRIPAAGQDSEALLRLPVWSTLLEVPDFRLLIWRGVGGREHVAEVVRTAGGAVDYLELYRRVAPPHLSEDLEQALHNGVTGILISSGQALEHWHLAAGDFWPQQRDWRCWVPSQRLADQARSLGCSDIIVCKGADDAAVLAALADHPLER